MITSNTMFVGSDVTFKVVFSTDTVAVTTGVSFLVSHKNAFTGKNYRQALVGTYSSEEGKWIIPFPASVQKDYGKYSLQCTISDWPMSGATQRVTFDNAVELTVGGAVQTIDLGTHTLQASDSEEVVVSSGFVRYDQAQTITPAGRLQACENIGAHRVIAGTGISITQPNESSGIIQIISLDAGAVVDTSSAQDIGGVKTFSSSPKVPTPTEQSDQLAVANKAYVTAHGGDGKQDALSSTQLAACNSGITTGKVSGYDTHVANNDIHVTAEQKTAWTAKQNALTSAQLDAVNSGIIAAKVGSYDSHVDNTTVHVSAGDRTSWNTKYSKPGTGIPKNDLASDVQTSLGKADSALQEHQSLTAYRTSAAQDLIDNGKQAKLNENQLAATNSGATAEKVSGYDTHVANTVVHVTTSDKSTWNSKQSALSEAQLAATNSGITSLKVATYDGYATGKQDVISDLSTIRSGAALGATALQSVPTTYRTAAEQDAIHDATKQDVISDLSTIRSGATAGSTAVQPGANTTFTGNNNFSGNNAFSGTNTFTGATNVPNPVGTPSATTALNYGYWNTVLLPTLPSLTRSEQEWTGRNRFTGTGSNSTYINQLRVNIGSGGVHPAGVDGGTLVNVKSILDGISSLERDDYIANLGYVDGKLAYKYRLFEKISSSEWSVKFNDSSAHNDGVIHEVHILFVANNEYELSSGQQIYNAQFQFIQDGEEPITRFNIQFGTRTLHKGDSDDWHVHVNGYFNYISGEEDELFSDAHIMLADTQCTEPSPGEQPTYTTTYSESIMYGSLRQINKISFLHDNPTLFDDEYWASTHPLYVVFR